MSKAEWYGLSVLAVGAILGFVAGGPFGLALSAVCLIVGLVLCVASVALGTKRKRTAAAPLAASPVQEKTQLLVLLKEVHARPQHNGSFQEIRDPNQADLQFEVFVRCWLVNDTDESLGIRDIRLSLMEGEGAGVATEQVVGDLGNWCLGKLRDELDSWGVRYLQAAQERMPELDTASPLEGGGSRDGWLHFRIQSLTPAQVKNASIELSVKDSHDAAHLGIARGPHHLPGRVWPIQANTLLAAVQNDLRGDASRPTIR
ncbi:MAG: hypothetical protein WA628_24690 [Terriglobales bacterium]